MDRQQLPRKKAAKLRRRRLRELLSSLVRSVEENKSSRTCHDRAVSGVLDENTLHQRTQRMPINNKTERSKDPEGASTSLRPGPESLATLRKSRKRKATRTRVGG